MRWFLLVAALALIPVAVRAQSNVPALPDATSLATGKAYIANGGANDTKAGFDPTKFALSGGNLTLTTLPANCAGINTTTTGTISSGTASLAVASASGWSIGMGIAVKNAGSGGTTELITTVDNIVGTTFTLHTNALATATGQAVNHDDTACLQAEINSGRNIHLPLGSFNITSVLTFANPMIFGCEGASIPGTTMTTYFTGHTIQNPANLTTIYNRSLTANMLDVNSGFVSIHDCNFQQVGTPTAGYWLRLNPSNATWIFYDSIYRNTSWGTFGGIRIEPQTAYFQIQFNAVFSLGGASNTSCTMYYNVPPPAGDNKIDFNTFDPITPGPAICINQGDTQQWIGNKVSSGDPDLQITGGAVNGQAFIGSSFEGGGNAGPIVNLSVGTGTTIVGGAVGVDDGHGCFNTSGTAEISVMGVATNCTGAVITNTSSAPKVNYWENPATANNTSKNYVGNITNFLNMPTSGAGGGINVCIDTNGLLYKKASCP